jgi:hypothetical protein
MTRESIVEQCEGCNRTEEIDGDLYCKAYAIPFEKWRLGNCPLCSTLHFMEGIQDGKKTDNYPKEEKNKKMITRKILYSEKKAEISTKFCPYCHKETSFQLLKSEYYVTIKCIECRNVYCERLDEDI